MCYYKKGGEIKKARVDITVYKIVKISDITKTGFKSVYQGFRYKFGKTHKTKFHAQAESTYVNSIYTGFHAYNPVPTYIHCSFGFFKTRAKKWGGSVSGFTNDSFHDSIIVECIIPKGTRYFYNGTDCVAEAIRPVAFLLPTFFNDVSFGKTYKSFKERITKYYTLKKQ